MAEAAGVDLGIEPEQANVVTSAADAMRLIGEMGSARVRIVLDPANLFERADRAEARAVVAEAIDLLGDRIAMAHGKDRAADGSFTTVGKGVVDFPDFIARLGAAGFAGPIVTHGLTAEEAPGVASYLRGLIDPMRVHALQRDDATLRVFDSGAGMPVVFQHGLGGDAAQVAENFPDGPAYRRLTVECRAQGGSTAGSVRPFSIAMFAADVLAACDARHFVVGGISTGAAIALRLAALHPDRVTALILARPAWLFDPAPANMRPFAEIARLLREHPPTAARERFAASPTARMLATEAPDNLSSLLKFFDRPDPAVTADLLADIAADGPGVTAAQAAAITVPTLVIGHAQDHVHPLAYAQQLAEILPNARLATITPKAADKPRHVAEFRRAVDQFLRQLSR